jgi:hypothetical protein
VYNAFFFGLDEEESQVRAMPEGYERKGKVVTFSLDKDAWELLKAQAPTMKAYGRYISELIRREAIRRQDWERGRPDLIVVAALID